MEGAAMPVALVETKSSSPRARRTAAAAPLERALGLRRTG